MPVVIERMMQSSSACRATAGRSSQNCSPGTLVAIGRNAVRISAGASGFGSNVSCCGGPPARKRTTHDFARAGICGSGGLAMVPADAAEQVRGRDPQRRKAADPQELPPRHPRPAP